MLDIVKEYWFLSLLLTVFLGALGSGVWEEVLKPLSRLLVKKTYTLITFGTKKSSRYIYKEAARGHHEIASLYLLAFFIIILIAGIPGYLTAARGDGVVDKMLDFSSEESVLQIENEYCSGIKNDKTKKKCIEDAIFKRQLEIIDDLNTYLNFGIIIVAIYLFYSLIAHALMNIVITYFNQCFNACAIYMSEEQRLKIKHDFSMMKERQDFDEIINAFSNIASEYNFKLPEM